MVFEVETNGLHETEGFGDTVGEFGIPARLRTVLDEAEHPLVHAAEIGVTALGQGAQQVERRGRLAINLDLASRIRRACRCRELDAVDDVAAIARQLDTI